MAASDWLRKVRYIWQLFLKGGLIRFLKNDSSRGKIILGLRNIFEHFPGIFNFPEKSNSIQFTNFCRLPKIDNSLEKCWSSPHFQLSGICQCEVLLGKLAGDFQSLFRKSPGGVKVDQNWPKMHYTA